MRTVGIIAEYNPFHLGHGWQLEHARAEADADYAVIILSGDFVQRGEPAIIDKYCRTEMALHEGADLVLELPAAYATGSAETFAQGSVAMLNRLGCIDTLCFGSECGSLPSLLSYARLFEEEPEPYRSLLKEGLRSGLSFPAARSRAAEEHLSLTERIFPCSAEDADLRRLSSILDKPNNLLGIEYCRAILRQHCDIRPLALQRQSADYHDPSLAHHFASATAIRGALQDISVQHDMSIQHTLSSLQGIADEHERSELQEASVQHESPSLQNNSAQQILAQLSSSCADILCRECAAHALLTLEDFSDMIAYRLLSLSREDLAGMQDVGDELADRILRLRSSFSGIPDFAQQLKTRDITLTRVHRALIHILLGLNQAKLQERQVSGYPAPARILGLRRSAAPLLSRIKERSEQPLLAKAADAPLVLNPQQLEILQEDTFAAHVYEIIASRKRQQPFRHDYRRSPVILD